MILFLLRKLTQITPCNAKTLKIELGENSSVYFKFFFPAGKWTWYMTEDEPAEDVMVKKN